MCWQCVFKKAPGDTDVPLTVPTTKTPAKTQNQPREIVSENISEKVGSQRTKISTPGLDSSAATIVLGAATTLNEQDATTTIPPAVAAITIGTGAAAGIIANNYQNLGTVYSTVIVESSSSTKGSSFPLYKFPPTNDNFYGREDTLQEIEEALRSCQYEENIYKRVIAITGLGGMGKSEMVTVLLSRLKSQYDYIYWFNAESEASLNRDFEGLAADLNMEFVSVSDLLNIYRHLAKHDKNGIFIFDDAPALKSDGDNFGIEEYLQPNAQCGKPLFIVTSRNPWGDVRTKIKCIPLNPLSDKDSRACILKYLGIEDQILPECLKLAVSSLVALVEGHPLGMSLLGIKMAEKGEQICFGGIESRVNSYIELLQDQRIEDLSEQMKYEARLQIIFNETFKNLEASDDVKIVIELLNISALLCQGHISVGFINGIICGKNYVPEGVFNARFGIADADTRVKVGLKILQANSLVRLETHKYRDFYKGNVQVHEYDMIGIHGLLQQCARNRIVTDVNLPQVLKKLFQFFELNIFIPNLKDLFITEYTFGIHIFYIWKFLEANSYVKIETSSLLMFAYRLNDFYGDRPNLFKKLQDFLRTRGLTRDEALLLRLVQLRICQESLWEFRYDRFQVNEIRRSILALSHEHSSKYWVIVLCAELFVKIPEYLDKTIRFEGLPDWLVKNYLCCRQNMRGYSGILRIVFQYWDTPDRDTTLDQKFIWKVFACTAEQERGKFWEDMWMILRHLHGNQRKEFLQHFFAVTEINLFKQTLQFLDELLLQNFLLNWCCYFCECSTQLVEFPDLKKLLFDNTDFIDTLLSITYLSLEFLSSVYTSNVISEVAQADMETRGIFCIFELLFTLFLHDVNLYKSVGDKLDSQVEDWLAKRGHSPKIPRRMNLTSTKTSLRKFSQVQYCSDRTKKWIEVILSN